MINQKILWLAVALLATTCVAQTYYIHYQLSPQTSHLGGTEALMREDEWFKQVRKRMLEGSRIPLKDFDDLFNDGYFDRGFEPFVEMKEMQRHFDSLLGQNQKSLFSQSWDDWFSDRMNLSPITAKTHVTDREVILELSIPRLDKKSLNIDVNKSRIRVAYDAKEIKKTEDGRGRKFAQTETYRHFEKILPVPSDADGQHNRIVREADVIKIIFPRRQQAMKSDA